MAIHIDSNSENEAQLKEAFKSLDLDVEANAATPVSEEPKPSSEPAGEPGAKAAEEPKGEVETGTEPVQTSSQEVPPPVVEEPKKTEKSKGGWQRKVDKLTAALETSEEREGRLRRERDELQARLNEVQAGKDPEKPEAEKEPERPKRPTMANFDFDQDKYEAAMAKYDTDMDDYYAKMSAKSAADAVARKAEEDKQNAVKAEAEKQDQEYRKRLNSSKEPYEDYDEVIDSLPDETNSIVDISDVARGYILRKASNPADLLYYFAKDALEGDNAETERLASLDPYDLTFELRKIEDQIKSAREKAAAPAVEKKVAPKAETKVEPAAPPKPKPQRTPDEPIEPTSRSTVVNAGNTEQRLREAAEKGDGSYLKLRRQQLEAAANRG